MLFFHEVRLKLSARHLASDPNVRGHGRTAVHLVAQGSPYVAVDKADEQQTSETRHFILKLNDTGSMGGACAHLEVIRQVLPPGRELC